MKETKLGALDDSSVSKIRKDYENNAKNTIIRHALSRTSLTDLSYDPSAKREENPSFSIEVKTLPACNQKASGRCWIFAGLNILREIVNEKLKIDDFQLSQNYISMFDKIEKANFALESIISLIDNDHDERILSHILHEPVSDGGQWDMFVNLVEKYGLLPQSAFPETYQSENTRELDLVVNTRIRHFAAEAKHLHEKGEDDAIRSLKDEVIEGIYHMFLNAFGIPPSVFDFEYTDKTGKYVNAGKYNAKSFFETFVGKERLEEYQSLINSPTNDKPYNRNFTVDYLGNVIEGKRINHLNITMERMKEVIVNQLQDGYPVWFGSDVTFYRDRKGIAWDDKALDYQSVLGFELEFSKEDMLDYWASAMNHAMVITGVNIVNGKINRWKIQNSWGSDNGLKGYYVQSGSWFDKFVYQAVVMKRYLNSEEKKAIDGEAIHLSPWDPMGTLAD